MNNDFAYIKGRLEDQSKWHSDKAAWNKKCHYTTEIITLVAGALIPVVNVLDVPSGISLQVASASLAALIVVSSSVAKLLKYQENWLSFRAIAEALEREKELYEHEVGDYAVAQNPREKLLVERIENMLASTTSQFLSAHRAEQPQGQPAPSPQEPEQ